MSEPARLERVDRDLELAGPHGGVTGYRLERMLTAMFALLAPGRPLPATASAQPERRHNWGIDEAYYSAEGDGILIGENCNGAVAGENVSVIYHLTVGKEVAMFVEVATDYRQDTLVFHLSATPAMIDVATKALLRSAAAEGLVLTRRVAHRE